LIASLQLAEKDVESINSVLGWKPTSLPTTNMRINNILSEVTLDSGAARNCISKEHFDRYFSKITVEKPDIKLAGASKSQLNVVGKCKLSVGIGKNNLIEHFYIIDGLSKPFLIGWPTFRNKRAVINAIDMTIEFRPKRGDPVVFHLIDTESQDAKESHKHKNYMLYITEQVNVPPQSEMKVECRLSKKDRDNILPKHGLVTSSTEQTIKNRITAARMVSPMSKDKYHIVIANRTTEPVTIKDNACIAQLSWIARDDYSEVQLNLIDELEDIDPINSIIEEGDKPDVPLGSQYEVPPELNISKDLSVPQQEKLQRLLEEYKNLFAKKDAPLPETPIHGVQHSINTGNARPVACPPRRISHTQKETVRDHINTMKDNNIIQKSRSPWASPVLLVPKKDGNWRFCIDYRALNEVTIKDVYPLPRIDDTLDALNGAQFMSTFDLQSGYWQIPMDKADVEKTAFVTTEGLFEYKRMPFGLCNAPATFQRHLDNVLAGLKWQCCLVYIDDIIVFSTDFDQHLKDIRLVFDRLQDAGLVLNSKKCHLCCNKVTFLGHSITPEGISPDPSKIEAIKKIDFSSTPEKIRLGSFIGLVGHYRKFIKDFAKIVLPLRVISHKDNPWDWNEECQRNFQFLKSKMTDAGGPILALPCFSGEFRFSVHTDASDAGIGAVLYQKDVDGNEKVIQFASRSLTKGELKWNTTEKEALAIIWACDHFRPYLIGTDFDVETDHQSLAWLKQSEKGRLARWAMKLVEYGPKIIHRPGKSNTVPDYLSRHVTTEHGKTDLEIPELDINFIFIADQGVILAVEDDELISEDDLANKKLKEPQKPIEPTAPKGVPWDYSFILEELLRNYQFDPQCKDIIAYYTDQQFQIENEIHAIKYAPFEMASNGLILKKSGSKLPACIYIPQHSRSSMLKHFHEGRLAGHLGRDKTFSKMQQLVWWPSMYKNVKRFVTTCNSCQLHKSSTQPKNRVLLPSYPTSVWSTAHIDLVGPLPVSERGMRYICVITDSFTKWSEAIAIPNKSEETVAECIFNNLICRHGVPASIRTDQGTEFTNKLMNRIMSRMGIKHKVGCPYYPQANGQVERFNKTLIESLAAQCDNEKTRWDHYLDGVLFGYRTSVHAELETSPFELLYGRKPTLPMSLLFGSIAELNEDVQIHNTRITYNLVRSHQLIQKLLKDVANARKEKWDTSARPIAISPGDSVLCKRPLNINDKGDIERSTKLTSDFLGPYKVVSVRDHAITIADTDREVNRTISVSNSKLYRIRDKDSVELLNENNFPEEITVPPETLVSLGEENIDSLPDYVPTTVDETINWDNYNRDDNLNVSWFGSTEDKNVLHDIDHIAGHKNGKGSQKLYNVIWEDKSEPSWIPAKFFASKNPECIVDYWTKVAPLTIKKDIPVCYQYLGSLPVVSAPTGMYLNSRSGRNYRKVDYSN
jgi:transposase InsO family protein